MREQNFQFFSSVRPMRDHHKTNLHTTYENLPEKEPSFLHFLASFMTSFPLDSTVVRL
jgi:hypothetical protein